MNLQDRINELLWDKRFLDIPNSIDRPLDMDYVMILNATLEDRNRYHHVRELEKKKCHAMVPPVPTEGEIFENAKLGGYWTDEDDMILKESEDHLARLKGQLDIKGFAARKMMLKRQIERDTRKFEKVKEKEQELKAMSSEYLAHEIACYSLARRLTCDEDGELLWTDEQSFIEFRDTHPALVHFILHAILSEGVWDAADVRELARSTDWRLTWSLCRENLPSIFNRTLGDMTLNQKLVVYWSRVYDSAFEDPKPPELDVINDDKLFDNWLSNRDLERKEQKSGEKVDDHQEQMNIIQGEYCEVCTCGVGTQKGVPLGMRKRHQDDCPFGTWRDYTREEKDSIAAKVYGRNTKRVRQLLSKEADAIQRHGTIEEQHLRNRKGGSRTILGSNTKVHRKNT